MKQKKSQFCEYLAVPSRDITWQMFYFNEILLEQVY